MSYEISNGSDFSLKAAASYTSSQYLAVDVSSSADGYCTLASAAGQPVIGVLQNTPDADAVASVRCGGITKWKVGSGGVTHGDLVGTNSAGKCVPAAKSYTNTSDAGAAQDALIGGYVLGKALASGAENDVIPVLITHAGAVPTTAA